MMWELQPDFRNELVAQAIRRNDFDNLFKFLHFDDNNHKDDDPYYKVRPIFKNLNRNSKWSVVQSEGKFLIDGIMVPYYRTKPFIYGKPIRYGFQSMG